MTKRESRIPIATVAERLRAFVLDCPEGTLIGSEDELVAKLGCSRSTVRQVARLLEREGLLRVRRGINGGYFGSRPDAGTIEATVSAYLETLDMDAGDVTVLASALWVEAVRKATRADATQRAEVTERLSKQVSAVGDAAKYDKIRDLELHSQHEIFKLANSTYIQLIFDINATFSRRGFPASNPEHDSVEIQCDFARHWREAKLLELNAIMIGDSELAALSARYSRKVWHRRVGERFAFARDSALLQD